MVHRDDPAGLIVLTQLAHAWISGQLAHAWGSDEFGPLVPLRDVLFAAEQHDIGWLDWERNPTLNHKTGRPHTFMELPVPIHTHLWGLAGPLSLVQGGRYAALLVSLHGSGLYTRRERHDTQADATLVRKFVENARSFEATSREMLRDDDGYAPHMRPEVLERNRRLIAVWDFFSLLLCMGVDGEKSIEHVPTASGETTLTLVPLNGDRTRIRVAPWPFRDTTVSLACEGRRLPQTFTDENAMRAALEKAPRLTLRLELQK